MNTEKIVGVKMNRKWLELLDRLRSISLLNTSMILRAGLVALAREYAMSMVPRSVTVGAGDAAAAIAAAAAIRGSVHLDASLRILRSVYGVSVDREEVVSSLSWLEEKEVVIVFSHQGQVVAGPARFNIVEYVPLNRILLGAGIARLHDMPAAFVAALHSMGRARSDTRYLAVNAYAYAAPIARLLVRAHDELLDLALEALGPW